MLCVLSVARTAVVVLKGKLKTAPVFAPGSAEYCSFLLTEEIQAPGELSILCHLHRVAPGVPRVGPGCIISD